MENEENKINLPDYGYTPETKVEISGIALMAFLNFLHELKERESQPVLLYSKQQLKDNRVDSKKPLKMSDVSIEEVDFSNPADFLSQGVQDALTLVGAKCLDFIYALEDVHYQAIQDGKAVKLSDLGTFKLDEIGKA